MKFRIHYTIKGVSDHCDIEGQTIEDVQEKAKRFLEIKGLNVNDNNVWSEEIE